MKTLIYQYYHTPTRENYRPHRNYYLKFKFPYWELSEKSIRAYAHKVGSDYKFLNSGHPICPYYGIFVPFLEGWCDDYDAICFIDSDMLATVNSESIWEYASTEAISAWCMPRTQATRRYPSLEYFHKTGHINTGTVIFPRAIYNDFKKELEGLEEYHSLIKNGDRMIAALANGDQAFINLFVSKQQNSKFLPKIFNYHLGRLSRNNRWEASLIHYHRDKKQIMRTEFYDDRILK